MVPEREPDLATFSKSEMDLVKKIAQRDGVSVEEAATRLGQQWLKDKVKNRTGKTAARVYAIKGRAK